MDVRGWNKKRLYWQLDYNVFGQRKNRYFHGTEHSVQNRINRYECEQKRLRNISKSRADFLKTEKDAYFIEL